MTELTKCELPAYPRPPTFPSPPPPPGSKNNYHRTIRVDCIMHQRFQIWKMLIRWNSKDYNKAMISSQNYAALEKEDFASPARGVKRMRFPEPASLSSGWNLLAPLHALIRIYCHVEIRLPVPRNVIY